ncbi:MAG: IS1634 family transposase [Synergistaceae bacterium]|jgi:transposase|nr:IS1634 family transposase [Synergistaceae bacterium]
MTSLKDLSDQNIAYQHNKKTGAVYVYSVQRYWDKEKKSPRNKQLYLGKLDPVTGELIPSARRKPRSKETFPNDSQAAVTAKVGGPSLLLQKIAADTGLADILKRCFPESHQLILSLVCFITQKGLPLSRCETWSSSHLHPFDAPIANQRVSELLRSITEDDRQRFLSLWLQKIIENDYLCYDITSISSYSHGNEFVRYGHNRDGEPLPQVNMAMLFGEKGKLPAYYRRIQGNISDVATLKTTMKSLDFLGASRIHFVLDRGFYSASNIDELLLRRHHFTIAVPTGRKWVEALIDERFESAASPSNYREVGENEALYMSTALYRWGEGKRRTYLHLYYNISKAGEAYDCFIRKLLEAKEGFELNTISEADRERYARYFIIKETSKRGGSVVFNDSEIQKYRNRYAGFFCILSNKLRDPEEALRVYRGKEAVENSFDDLKNQLDMKRLRVHDSRAMDSRFFLQFLSLIFICYIRNTLRKHDDLKNFTVREAMELLEPIVRIKYSGRHGQLYTEMGPKQRNIMAVFNVPLPVA